MTSMAPCTFLACRSDLTINRLTVGIWLQTFDPEPTKRTGKYPQPDGLDLTLAKSMTTLL